jgi:hypothetical protein
MVQRGMGWGGIPLPLRDRIKKLIRILHLYSRLYRSLIGKHFSSMLAD